MKIDQQEVYSKEGGHKLKGWNSPQKIAVRLGHLQ